MNVTKKEIPNDKKAIQSAIDWIIWRAETANFSQKQNKNLKLAITEAFANAFLHGNQTDPKKKIYLSVEEEKTHLTVGIEDEGKGFNTEGVPNPLETNRLRVKGGRGIFLINRLVDEAWYNPQKNSIFMLFYHL